MNELRLSIRQTFAAIGIESRAAQQSIQSYSGDQQIKQPQAEMNFSSTPAQLEIDSSQAWSALAKGPHMEWNQQLYSQMKSVFLQNLAQRVQEGHQMANITNKRNAFADIAKNKVFDQSLVNYIPETPDYDNVHISYSPGDVDTAITPSLVEIEYTPIKPEIQVDRGKLDIYLRQKNSISIDVTTYDWYK
ncbi:DUF6470 family protein [Paenibacillus harenae]|uniref:Uncharacterized protein n=1 Tax=Paenibacillus harenae TaxID=306543 RepID=A0ABT9UA66_PAEHA|nr:DUF6470 family protein [Paenibacillus harenae]MDQ0116554.1 hypothetical protein [Paenibacillus harenae]